MTVSFDFFSKPKPASDRINQDAITAFEIDCSLVLAIADGMGGKPGGEIASSTAIQTIENELRETPKSTLAKLYASVQDQIKTAENDSNKGMGTTLTICRITGESAFFAHVGDTRIYHLRGNGIRSITKDQTELQELLDKKVITKARAERYHRKNILTSVLTSGSTYTIQSGEFDVQTGDTVILLSDGLYSAVTKKTIRDLNLKFQSASELAQELEKAASASNPKDDYSAIVIRF